MSYVPALDGIRALAILLVICCHAKVPFLHGGYLGVDIFFVLSGFLITHILMSELDQSGRISFSCFYVRRFSRLLPAMALLLIAYNLSAHFFFNHTYAKRSFIDSALVGFYLTDFPTSFWEVSKPLFHSWSLSIEEHYYLLWPTLLFFTRKIGKEKFILIILSMYVLATGWRFFDVIGAQNPPIYGRFDMRCSGLVLGSFLAALRIEKTNIASANVLLAVFLSLMLYALISQPDETTTWGFTVGIFIAQMATFFVINACVDQKKTVVKSVLSWPPLVYLGKISYGVYLYHYPIAVYLGSHLPWYSTLVMILALTLPIAALSFHLVERPILIWARKNYAQTA